MIRTRVCKMICTYRLIDALYDLQEMKTPLSYERPTCYECFTYSELLLFIIVYYGRVGRLRHFPSLFVLVYIYNGLPFLSLSFLELSFYIRILTLIATDYGLWTSFLFPQFIS